MNDCLCWLPRNDSIKLRNGTGVCGWHMCAHFIHKCSESNTHQCVSVYQAIIGENKFWFQNVSAHKFTLIERRWNRRLSIKGMETLEYVAGLSRTFPGSAIRTLRSMTIQAITKFIHKYVYLVAAPRRCSSLEKATLTREIWNQIIFQNPSSAEITHSDVISATDDR